MDLPLGALEAPAAGAPLVQIAIAGVAITAFTAGLLWLVTGHLSGRVALLGRAGDHASRALGLEPWAALPFAVASAGLAAGGFGVFWDIALHIDVGRDEGPLANPSHYPILLALYSCFAAGLLAVALHARAERPAPRALRLPGGFQAPVGGALLLGCGAFALTGFPLDDVWHRMFGQDVTLWGPTHLVMINGAILSVPAMIVLVLEAKRAGGRALGDRPVALGERFVRDLLPGGLLFAILFWATEFDWGVPQYRMVWHPILIAVATSLSFVAARLWLGRLGAVRLLVGFLVMRGFMELSVLVLGQTVPAMPLPVVEALAVTVLGWRGDPAGRAVRFGLTAGALCGTLGFAAAYGWTQVWAPMPWTTGLLAEGIPSALAGGLAGGLLGALLGAGLCGRLPSQPVRRRAGLVATATLVAIGANALWTTEPDGLRADVVLEPVAGAGQREAHVVARVDPPVQGTPEAFTATAWQGGGIVVATMERGRDGLWRSDRPVPLHGTWKTSLRLQDGRTMVAVPLSLPREPSIPTPGVVRPERFSASFVPDVQVMQTERRDYVPGWLWTPAALLMLLFCGLFVAAISAGLVRAVEDEPATPGGRPRPRWWHRLPGRSAARRSPGRTGAGAPRPATVAGSSRP